MKITYSPDADALYVRLARAAAKSVGQREVLPGVILDLSARGTLVGIEILGASRYDRGETFTTLGAPDAMLTLQEAAQFAGLKAASLRNQILNGRLRAVKRGRDWVVDANVLEAYLEARSPAGRPPSSGRRRPAVTARSPAAPRRPRRAGNS